MKSSPSPFTDLLHSITGAKVPRVSALILAGGSGTRLGADITKQFVCIDGIPVIVRTLLAFEECPYIEEIIVAAKANETELYPPLIEKYALNKVKAVVPGGADRQESALHAFEKASERSKYIAIHDGARCLITPDQIKKVVLEAIRCRAAIAATKAKDTVKLADSAQNVASTPDRSSVWAASTPQVILADMYRAAAYTAQKDHFKGTDDASLCERLGFSVRLVDVGDENIKITTKTDLLLAEAILRKRKEESETSEKEEESK